jgi:hypothetical protein
VYVSSSVSHEEGKPEHLMRRIHPPDDDEGEWNKWCIREYRVGWEPADTLVKLTTMMRASLEQPDSDNPFQGAV